MFSESTLHLYTLNDLQCDSGPRRVQLGLLVEYKETVLEVPQEHYRERLRLVQDQLVQIDQNFSRLIQSV